MWELQMFSRESQRWVTIAEQLTETRANELQAEYTNEANKGQLFNKYTASDFHRFRS